MVTYVPASQQSQCKSVTELQRAYLCVPPAKAVKYDFHQELPVRRNPFGGGGVATAARLWIPKYLHKPTGNDEVNG